MKKTILLLLLCCVFAACGESQPKPFNYVLKGKLPSTKYHGQTMRFYYLYEKDKEVIADIPIVGDSIVYHGTADSVFYARVDGASTWCNFIVEKGTIVLDLDTWLYPSGTPLNNQYAEVYRKYKELSAKRDELRKSIMADKTLTREERIRRLNEHDSQKNFMKHREQRREIATPYILANSNNALGLALVLPCMGDMVIEYNEAIYQHLGERITSNEIVKMTMQFTKGTKNRQPGNMFVDFTGEDIDGKPVSLSDYVGKGKWVLIDFSASWCSPCHAEIPYIKEVYERFKNDGLEVVTIVVWDKPERARKFLKDYNFPWPSIIELSDNARYKYGVPGIPQLVLFAPDGTVVDSQLRQGEIMPTVEKAMKGEKKEQ